MSLCANFSFCSSNLFIVHSNSRIFFSQVPSGDPVSHSDVYVEIFNSFWGTFLYPRWKEG
jgi:hypothetical protein